MRGASRIILATTAFSGYLFGAAVFSQPAFSAGKIISSQAGRVNRHVVTTREVAANAWVEYALGQKNQVKNLDLNEPKSKEFLRETTAVLLEWAIYLEAESFATSTVTRAERASAIRIVKSKLKNQKKWRALRLESHELESLVERKLRAKKFIQFKVESSAVPVSDAEARQYFETNRLKFENLPFESFKETIRTYLSRQQVDRRLKDWFELLQVKYKVRNYLVE